MKWGVGTFRDASFLSNEKEAWGDLSRLGRDSSRKGPNNSLYRRKMCRAPLFTVVKVDSRAQ